MFLFLLDPNSGMGDNSSGDSSDDDETTNSAVPANVSDVYIFSNSNIICLVEHFSDVYRLEHCVCVLCLCNNNNT